VGGAGAARPLRDGSPVSRPPERHRLAAQFSGGQGMAWRSRRVLTELAATNSGFPVYGYDFTYQNAPYYFPQMPNAASPSGHFQPLAAHTSDIQFVFQGYHGGNLGVNLDETSGQPRELQGPEITLSDQIVGAWTRFAKTGNPNGPRLPTWQAFTPGVAAFLQQGYPKLGRNRRAIQRQLQVRILGEPGSQPIDGGADGASSVNVNAL
jgi:carboxylesterase type B